MVRTETQKVRITAGWSGLVNRFLTRGPWGCPANFAMGRRGASAGTYTVRGTLILVQVLTFLLSLPDLES